MQSYTLATRQFTPIQYSTFSHGLSPLIDVICMNDLRIRTVVFAILYALAILTVGYIFFPSLIAGWATFSTEFILGTLSLLLTSVITSFNFVYPKLRAAWIIAFHDPYDLNDTVKIGEVIGVITKQTLLGTKLTDHVGQDIYIKNTDVVNASIYNYTAQRKSLIVIHASLEPEKFIIAQGLITSKTMDLKELEDFYAHMSLYRSIEDSHYWVVESTTDELIIMCQYDISTSYNTQSTVSGIVIALKNILNMNSVRVINPEFVVGELT